jgi:hypothetical protein
VYPDEPYPLPIADTPPLYTDLLLDTEGNAWLQDFEMPPEDPDTQSWSVYDQGGRWLGTVEFAESIRLRAVGADVVVGLERNEYNVPLVVVYRLHR